MEEVPPTGAEGTDPPEPAVEIPPLPPELASGEEELRRMVDAGASSPEELRALAARLQEQRSLEESAWRREVRPALMKAKKARLADLVPRREERDTSLRTLGAVLAGVVLLLVIAAQTSFYVLLVAVVGVLAYAYVQGRAQ